MANISLKKALQQFPQTTLSKVTNPKTGKVQTRNVLKTMQCGLAISLTPKQRKVELEELSPDKKKLLDEYIDTFENKKQLILEDFYHYYEKSIWDFLIYCSRIKDTTETTYIVIPELPEITTKIKKSDGTYLKVKAYKGISNTTGNIHKTLYWFADDIDTKDGCTKVQFQYTEQRKEYITTDNYEKYNFDPALFELQPDTQQISNRISFFYMTNAQKKDKNGIYHETPKYQEYKKKGISIKGIVDDIEIDIKEPLRTKTAAVLKAFVDKLQESIKEIESVISEKNERIALLNKEDPKNNFPEFFVTNLKEDDKKLLSELTQLQIEDRDVKKFSELYNTLAKSFNQILNNAIQTYISIKLKESKIKQSDKEQEGKRLWDTYHLNHLKGIPSFPQMKNESQGKITAEMIYHFIQEQLQQYKNFSAFDHLLLDKNDFIFTDQKRKLSEDTVEQEQEWKEQWKTIKEKENNSFILTLRKILWRKNNIPGKKLMHYAHYLVQQGKITTNSAIVKALIEYALQELLKKQEHLSCEQFSSDQKAKREFCDYARIIISFIAYQLKKEEKRKEARNLELQIDDMSGNYKGTAFDLLKKGESNILPLSGFDFDNHGTKKGACLVFRNTTDHGNIRTHWYFALNLYNKIHFEEFDQQYDHPLEYPVDQYFVLASKGNDKTVSHHIYQLSPKEFDPGSKTMLIPLLLGTRQLREYITNFEISPFKNLLYFNSAEIQRIRNHKEEQYFLNLVTTRPEVEAYELTQEKKKGLIGIDRGENTVAWAALVNTQGNPLFEGKDERNFIELAPKFGKKFREEYKEISKRQSHGSVKKLNIQGRVKKVIEGVGAKIISNALEYGLQIVLENLDRGFGRHGKNTFVGVRQFTHLQKFIESKLKQNNISFKKDSILQTVPAAYTSKMCSNCGVINSLTGKEDFIAAVIEQFKDHPQQKDPKISCNKLCINLDQEITSWDRNKKREVVENSFEKIKAIFSNTKIQKHEAYVEIILKKLLNPRKEKADLFKCNFCGHTCHADKQAALNIARFSLLPYRSESEKKKGITAISKLEEEYQQRLNDGIFQRGSLIL